MRQGTFIAKRTGSNEVGRTQVGRAILAALVMLISTNILFGCAKTRDDASISAEIQSRFYSDPAVKGANIQVVVNRGKAILTGDAPSPEVKDHAVLLTRETPGIVNVEDHIAITVAAAPAFPPPTTESAPSKPKKVTPRRKGIGAAREETSSEKTAPSASSSAGQPLEQVPAITESARPLAQPRRVTIPAGTHLSVGMIDSIDSSKDRAGQLFQASLDSPIVVDAEEVVPAGADVYVRLATAKAAGKMTGSSELELQLVKMVATGQTYPLVSDSYVAKGKSRGVETATRVGAGAAVGAIVGAIAGGKKGAAIGAAAGAGAGTAVQLATRGQQVKVPSETLLDFELQQPVVVTKE